VARTPMVDLISDGSRFCKSCFPVRQIYKQGAADLLERQAYNDLFREQTLSIPLYHAEKAIFLVRPGSLHFSQLKKSYSRLSSSIFGTFASWSSRKCAPRVYNHWASCRLKWLLWEITSLQLRRDKF
jgi:hypothetical protein